MNTPNDPGAHAANTTASSRLRIDGAERELAGEFAAVTLTIDHEGNGPRLRIEDLRTGHVGYLDPLELETLAWLPEGALHKFLDPSFHRWREQSHGDADAAGTSPHAHPAGDTERLASDV